MTSWEEVRAKLKKGYLLHTWHRTTPPNIWVRHPANGRIENYEWRDVRINWKELELVRQGEDIIAPTPMSWGRMVNHGPEEKVYRLR